MGYVVLILLIGLIPAMIAANKGRSFLGWYLYGCLLFLIALVHALLLKSPTQKAMESRMANLGTAEELERFSALRDKGVITDEEFAAKKRELLTKPDMAAGQF